MNLSPSTELLQDYHNGLSWDKYVETFTRETLSLQSGKIKGLAKKALTENVTLLCYEDGPENCHRRLVALACQMYEPGLQLELE
ncbi:DUF488 domain-containing protein [archaeon]|nr:DUF488 domain-containing protein [archaeon]